MAGNSWNLAGRTRGTASFCLATYRCNGSTCAGITTESPRIQPVPEIRPGFEPGSASRRPVRGPSEVRPGPVLGPDGSVIGISWDRSAGLTRGAIGDNLPSWTQYIDMDRPFVSFPWVNTFDAGAVTLAVTACPFGRSHNFPLIDSLSHAKHCVTETRAGTHKGRPKNPTTVDEAVSYRQSSFPNKEIRRASEQTSPQVARAVGLAPQGEMAADQAVAAA